MARGSSFTFDAKAFSAAIAALGRPELDAPVALALVDTAKTAIAKASSLIAKRTGLRVGTVKAMISYDHVGLGDYQVTIRSSRRPTRLIDFPSTRAGGGGVLINVWGKSQLLRGAFIATMPTGHRGVYRRISGARLPIKELWGPTVSGTFSTPEVQSVIRATMQDRLRTALLRRIASARRRK